MNGPSGYAPPTRRRLLGVVTGLGVGLSAGCLGNDSTDTGDNSTDTGNPDDVAPPDCAESRRPNPPDPEPEESVSPFDYPSLPTDQSEDALASYVESFERAYVGNEWLEAYGEELVGFGLLTEDRTVTQTGPPAVVEIEYQTSEVTGLDDRDKASGTSGHLIASYAIWSETVRRAVAERGGSQPPDARKTGDIVVCPAGDESE
ncbi:hypothetical protein [Natrinema salaciae]|uniref:Uncharacterized protein n=1 Tax=Natrinema salaciae TaxID=1186196 RepID=A0A1H9JIH0_9EURY|nr:hypothetical protein [Natrinema salaciae]SEQ86589.1 hypothetical protein SAMN04489841_2571 [Natrinema salaciae]